MNHLRVPLFLADRPPAVAMAWLYLLRAWFSGEYPSVRDIARRGPISVGVAHELRREAYAWANAAGWKLPPSACPEASPERSPRTQPTVHDERETAGSNEDAAFTTNGAERSPRTPRAIAHAPAVPCGDQKERKIPEARPREETTTTGDDHDVSGSPTTVGNAATATQSEEGYRAVSPVVRQQPDRPKPDSRPADRAPAPRDDRGDPGPDTSPVEVNGRRLPGDLTALLWDLTPGGRALSQRLVQQDKVNAVCTTRELLARPADELHFVPGLGGEPGARRVAEFLRSRWGVEPGCLAATADPDLAAWDLIWTLPAPVPQGPPLPDGTLSPRHLRAVQALGGRLAIRSASTFDIPKLKARFIEACRSAS